jgi:hypothetical protein
MQQIEPGFMVFLGEGKDGAGAVREVRPEGGGIVVNIENGGDFTLPLSAVRAVHDDKVILDFECLSTELRDALHHLHDAEYPLYAAADPEQGTPMEDEPPVA